MIFYTVFNSDSGEIVITGTAQQEEDVAALLSAGQAYLLEYSDQNQYVSDGAIVSMPPKPSDDHLFDYTTKTWVIDTKGATVRALAKRNQLLADGPDRVSPLWWAAMSLSEKAEVAEYRQALLNITDQAGYPLQIDWPPPPALFSQ